MSILDDIYNILWQLANYIAELMLDFVQWMTTTLASIVNTINALWTAATNLLKTTLDQIKLMVQSMVNGVLDTLESFVSAIQSAFATAWGIVRDTAVGIVNNISNLVINLIAAVRANITAMLDGVRVVWTQFIDKVEALVAAFIQFAVDLYNDAVSAINAGLASIVTTAKDVLTSLGQTVTAALNALVAGPTAVFNALSTRFNDLGTALREAIAALVEQIIDIPSSLVEQLKAGIDAILKALVDWSNAPELASTIDILHAITTAQTTPADYQSFVGNILKRFSPATSLGRGVVFILLTAIAALPALLSAGSIYAQPMTQALAAEFPYQLLAVPDVIASVKRGLLSPATGQDILKRHGYGEADIATMFAVAETIPQELDALHFWHRKLIDDKALSAVFQDRGFTATWASIYKQASFIVPPPQDLITMAVREVFSPDVAARFGLFDDFPEDFAKHALNHGLTADWSLKYWGAHWALPSATQGFEMFHRDIIKQPDLELLLRALDVMPFWRERLIQLAYNPYTRVDIRRMHQLGVLTNEDVLRAHLDLGYSPERAQKLTEFVIRLNRNAPGEDDVELGRLSRAAVLGFYEDGILARERAHQLLTSLGITPEAGSLYLDSVDNDQQRAERKAETDLVIAQAEAGLITFGQAQDRLNNLGLESGEIQKALARLARSEQARTKIPTRGDGETFFKQGLITAAAYLDLLLRLGYSNQWAAIYVQSAMREVEGDKDTRAAGA